MKKVVLLLLASFLVLRVQALHACGDVFATNSSDSLVPDELWNDEGWDVPGLADSRVSEAATPDTRFNEETSVTKTILQPGSQRTFKDISYEMHTTSGQLELKPSKYVQLITQIRQFAVANRPFLYVVVTETATDCSKRKPGEICGGVLGCGYTYFCYYDENGDGRFQRMLVQRTQGVSAPNGEALKEAIRKYREKYNHVPEWAKQLARTQKPQAK